MNTAQTTAGRIARAAIGANQAASLATEQRVKPVQRRDFDATDYTFEDGSGLRVCGSVFFLLTARVHMIEVQARNGAEWMGISSELGFSTEHQARAMVDVLTAGDAAKGEMWNYRVVAKWGAEVEHSAACTEAMCCDGCPVEAQRKAEYVTDSSDSKAVQA
jgi:hypothetical protein